MIEYDGESSEQVRQEMCFPAASGQSKQAEGTCHTQADGSMFVNINQLTQSITRAQWM